MAGLILALSLAVASWRDDAPAPEWTTVSPEGGMFSISMPGKPEHKNAKKDGDSGPSIDLHIAFYDKSLFIVSTAERPAKQPARDERDPKPFLEMYRNASLKPLNGKILNERSISQDGAPGLETEADVQMGEGPLSVMKTRRYLVGRRLVELSVMSPKGFDSSKNTARFFDSFRLKPGATADGRSAEWVTFTAIAGRFAVRMPGHPTVSVDDARKPAEPQRARHGFEASRDGISFRVVYSDPPRATGGTSSSNPDLKAVLDGLVRETGGELKRDKVLTFDGQPGREFEIAVAPKSGRPAGVVLGRLAVSEGRVFQVTASGPPASSSSKDVAAFMSSFRATKPAPRRPGWSESSVKAGRFAVNSPGKLVETIREIRTPSGPKPLHDFSFGRNDSRVFAVAYSDMDRAGMSGKAADEAHANSRSRMVEVLHAKIISEELVSLDDEHQSWTMTVELPGPAADAAQIMRVREFVDGRRVYTVTVMTPKSNDSAADAEAFLNSFRIIPEKK